MLSRDVRQYLGGRDGPAFGLDSGPQYFLNIDERGGAGPNGKPSYTVDEAAAQITRSGDTWNGYYVTGTPATVTYAFRDTAPFMPSDTSGFSHFNAQQIAGAELALQSWSDVANITFVRVNPSGYSDDADILFGNYDSGMSAAAAFAFFPGGGDGGDVWVNVTQSYNADPVLLDYGRNVLVHEIGHAIGLSHPGDYNAGNGFPSYETDAVYYEDSRQYTVMSYWSETETGGDFQGYYAAAPLLDDIAAVQRLYGANWTTRSGDTTYGFNSTAGRDYYSATDSSTEVIFAVWDGGGTDTLDFSGYADDQLIDLREGYFSNVGGLVGNVTIAVGAVIENAFGGSGSDTINGNAADNLLKGNGGADVLNGGAGNDMLAGGAGDDDLNGGEGSDTADYEDAGSAVTLNLSLSARQNTGAAGQDLLSQIENVAGSSFNDTLTGNGSDNVLTGGAGDDRLDGGGGQDTAGYSTAASGVTVDLRLSGAQDTAGDGMDTLLDIENLTGSAFHDTLTGTDGANVLDGGGDADTLSGGLGNDTYVVDNVSDQLIEGSGGGVDLVESSISYALAANLENLTLIGTASINGTGNSGANNIAGNSGDNVLDGGAGADIMNGGLGDDTYIADNSGDQAAEDGAGGGVDLVKSSVSFTLGAGIEKLTLTGTAAINGTGNALDNVISGNSANNLLDGGDGADLLDGGVGADTMTGGLGDDTFVIDNSGDQAIEGNATGGTDLVKTSLSFTLGANIEKLTLIGSAAINGTGNALANVITGNSANNVLNGGTGADFMAGGLGNDTYIVDNSGDQVAEASGAGVDLVKSSASFALGANVENLTLTGNAAVNGTGNGLANVINGNSANNILDGRGGADVMSGGLGNDTYVVDNAGDVLSESSAAGTDLVESSLTFTLGANFENLALTGNAAINGTGNGLANMLTGNSATNILHGGDGADTLDGGAGADTLYGGLGNDTFVIDDFGDQTIENSAAGVDLVRSSITAALGENIENLTLTGSAAIDGVGNALANALTGNAGNNVLTGGAGVDVVRGAGGDDTLVIAAATDVVSGESYFGGGGTDQLQVQVYGPVDLRGVTIGSDVEQLYAYDTVRLRAAQLDAFTSVAAQEIDIATGGVADLRGASSYVSHYVLEVGGITLNLAGSSSYANITGSSGADTIFAGDAGSVIDGGAYRDSITGGAGSDSLTGGAGLDVVNGGGGDDTLIVAAASDVVAGETYSGGAGIDQLQVQVSDKVDFTGVTLAHDIEQLSAYGTVRLTAAQLDSLGYVQAQEVDVATSGVVDLRGATNYVSQFVLEVGGTTLNLAGTSGYTTVIGSDGADVVFAGDGGSSIDGGAYRDTLTGGAGSDWLTGGAGLDAVRGGGGDDYLIIAEATDMVAGETYAGGAGNDQLQVRVYDVAVDLTGVTLDTDIEQLYAYGTVRLTAAQLGAFNYVQAQEVDIATAGTADLRGATSYASHYVLQVAGITLNLAGTTSYANVTGSAGADTIIGGDGNSLIDGGAGADALTGGLGGDNLTGGAGADVVRGAGGDDVLLIAAASDIAPGDTYYGGGGTDQLKIQVSDSVVDLTGATIGTDVEQLYAYGTVRLTAGQLDAFDSLQAQEIDIATAGIADLRGATNYVSHYVLQVGGITLNLAGTSSYINVTGSSGADAIFAGDGGSVIDGGAYRDTLTGGNGSDSLTGGAGLDAVKGGAGDDLLIIAASSDVVSGETYAGGAGNDQLQVQVYDKVDLTGVTIGAIEQLYAYSDVRLTAAQLGGFNSIQAQEVEIATAGNVDLTAATGYVSHYVLDVGGTTLNFTGNASSINVTGSAGADAILAGNGGSTIDAGAGADTLNGGTATDYLTGGAGSDHFIFDDSLSGVVDEIYDFSSGSDQIQIDDDIFTSVGALGTLSANAFYSGTAAHDADDRIIYDAASGYIYYDADGNGAGAAVAFAHLTAGLSLTNADFHVIG